MSLAINAVSRRHSCKWLVLPFVYIPYLLGCGSAHKKIEISAAFLSTHPHQIRKKFSKRHDKSVSTGLALLICHPEWLLALFRCYYMFKKWYAQMV